MADGEKRFLNYENSMSIYRSKTAFIIGVLYFSKGYQSTPVLGMQFAQCVDPDADQKVFDWDGEDKVWYYPTYDKCYELYRKLAKWKAVLANIKQKGLTDKGEIEAATKDFADKNKISNPVKKKSLYISMRYYAGYFITLSFSGTAKISVSISEDELEMLLQYTGDFIRDYHSLALQHRLLQMLKGQDGKQSNGGSSYNKSGTYSGGKAKSTKSDQPTDSSPKSGDVENILGGAGLDDILNSLNPASTAVDDDIPF